MWSRQRERERESERESERERDGGGEIEGEIESNPVRALERGVWTRRLAAIGADSHFAQLFFCVCVRVRAHVCVCVSVYVCALKTQPFRQTVASGLQGAELVS